MTWRMKVDGIGNVLKVGKLFPGPSEKCQTFTVEVALTETT
jgi:hypothetical protein